MKTNYTEAARLYRQLTELEAAWEAAEEKAINAVAKEFLPKVQAILDQIRDLKRAIDGMNRIQEQIFWEYKDRENHDTDDDTTARMKRSQGRERRAKSQWKGK